MQTTETRMREYRAFAYALTLLKPIARSLSNLDLKACNYGLTERDEKRKFNLMTKANGIADRLGMKAYHQGDPRGCSLYLIDDSCILKRDGYENVNYTDGIAIK